ncbi:PIG-L family deacetylase [Amycolatopsis sp. NPDC059657]|uniref:PIG-L family deacetylase n=1 Tax=Amycolatopsis sp. NPDC059657 TaxID=3346899 RepID=UPI00366F2F45
MSNPESLWPPVLRGLDPFPLERFRRACVVAAHPDDETLGVSGLLQRLHAQGTEITLVIATDGEAAFPDADAAGRRELGKVRRRELHDSLRTQRVADIEPVWLGLPDSRLAGHAEELTTALGELTAGADLVLAPWPEDPHPDHQVAGRAALAAAPVTAHRWSYPIWLWHWLSPDDPAIQWSRAFAFALSEDERDRKRAGVGAFTSQLKPGPHGEDPILPPEVLAHFERDTEILLREPQERSAPVSRFAELYRDNGDPWRVSSSWYERRKRAVTLAALPQQRYSSAVEPACGLGALTRELAPRCDHLLAFDPVDSAVERTRAAVADLSTVDVHIGALPADLPDGPVDLIVLSEILYYLSDDDLTATIEQAALSLRSGGDLVAVHWRQWPPEAPRDGRAAHERLLAHPELAMIVEHLDEAFVLHVLRRR